MTTTTPGMRPANPHFSSGPTAKRPGWSPENLRHALLGRAAIVVAVLLFSLARDTIARVSPASDPPQAPERRRAIAPHRAQPLGKH